MLMKRMNTEKIWVQITVEAMAVKCLRANLEQVCSLGYENGVSFDLSGQPFQEG